MPYQLIYTSAARLLDSPLSGYGTVARSEKMSPLLVSRLVELSEYKEPAEQGIFGPQFSYRVEECGNSLYHIFTSVRPAGADYSKRSCHIAHHLILQDEEMHNLCRSAMPPTPAGILLSLELNRFWVHRWQREPEYLPENATPALAGTPTADTFPTWLVFTGNAANAKAFQTPPYQQGCLILVPPRTQSRDILRLLHESYTLSPTLGWGIPFCTYGVESDSLESRQRLFSIADSALHKRAQRLEFPFLEIKPGLVLPDPAPTSPISPMSPQPIEGSVEASTARALSDLPSPQTYFYVEDRSNGTFEKPWRKEEKPPRVSTGAICTAALLIAALAAAGFFLLANHRTSPEKLPPTPAEIPPALHTKSATEQPATATEPQPLPAVPEPTSPAEVPTTADTPEPAVEPAHTAQQTEQPAAVDVPEAPEPLPSDAEQQTQEDLTISDLDAATAQSTAPAQEEERQEIEYTAAKCITIGSKLPESLLNILPAPTKEVPIEHGEYKIHLGEEKDGAVSFEKNKKEYSLKLSPGKAFITLRCTEIGVYTLSSADGKLPGVTLMVEDKTLRSITSNGNMYTAVQLPIMQQNDKCTPLLLLPHLEFCLQPAEAQHKHEAKKFDIKFNRGWITKKDDQNEVSIKKIREEAWAKESIKKDIVLAPTAPAVKLHMLGFNHEIEIQRAKTTAPACYRCRKEKEKDDSVKLHLEHVLRPAHIVREWLENYYLNNAEQETEQKAGKTAKKSPTLANVHNVIYSISNSRKNKAIDDSLLQKYFNLYIKNPALGDKLREIYVDQHEFTLQKQEMNSGAVQKDIAARLKRNPAILLAPFEKYLSTEMTEYCNKQYLGYLAEQPASHVLRLTDVEIDNKDKKIIWKFELEPAL